MMTTVRHSAGFTIIEISLVLIVLGILAAAFLPMIQTTHDDVLRKQDMASMEAARDALMGYIRINEGIPCVDAGGTQVTTGCDPTETLDLLGIRTTDSRRMPFAYDVNDTLTVAEIAASGNSLCTALANIINPAIPPATPPDPTICDSDNANTGDVACTATHPMALVLVGRGSDRCLNLENTHANAPNDGVCETAVLDNRTFENPVRLSSRTQDDGYYEDLVYTITPNELAEAMECPAGGGGGTNFALCGGGETLVQVSNGDNSAMSISTGGSCYVISEGTTASMGCQLDSTAITVYANQSCTSNLFTNTLSGLDTNNDGRADVVCDNANVCTWR